MVSIIGSGFVKLGSRVCRNISDLFFSQLCMILVGGEVFVSFTVSYLYVWTVVMALFCFVLFWGY